MVTALIQKYIYTVEVHEAEEGGYWGEVYELPGCVSQGETLEELKRNIREAIEAVGYEDEAEQGRITMRLPSPRTKDANSFVLIAPETARHWRLSGGESQTATGSG